jgi:hypothetical protein
VFTVPVKLEVRKTQGGLIRSFQVDRDLGGTRDTTGRIELTCLSHIHSGQEKLANDHVKHPPPVAVCGLSRAEPRDAHLFSKAAGVVGKEEVI